MSLLDCSDKPYINSGHFSFLSFKIAISFESVTSLQVQNLQFKIFHLDYIKTTALVGPSGQVTTLILVCCVVFMMLEGERFM